MVIDIPIAIVAHPKRKEMAEELAETVGAEAIVWDIHQIGPADNHLQAWKWLSDTGAEFGCVLEDDVLPCEDFRRNLEEAIRASPLPILSLYLGRGRPPQYAERRARAIAQDVSFITAQFLMSAQGYAMRTDLFAEHETVGVIARNRDQQIDQAIGTWASWKSFDHMVAYCRRSIVDHRDGPTLVEDHGDGRGRNGLTELVRGDCDPSGAQLPEIRKAWLMAGLDTKWTRNSVAL